MSLAAIVFLVLAVGALGLLFLYCASAVSSNEKERKAEDDTQFNDLNSR